MAATTSSSSYSNIFSLRSSNGEPRVRSPAAAGCSKLDGVAIWFVNGVAAAFFASLERCSCIRVATYDDDGEEANDVPLIHSDPGTTRTRRGRTGKGKNGRGGAFLED